MKRKKSYDVGYQKPPQATQFEKGKSGNKKGRPRGAKNFNTDVKDILNHKVTITENGQKRRVTTQRAMMMRLRGQALAGDHKAMDKLLTLAKEIYDEQSSRAEEREISKEEINILERYRAAIVASERAKTGGSLDV